MKKSSNIVIVVIVLVVLAAGGFLFFHKSNKSNGSSASNNSAAAVNNSVLVTKNDSSLGQYLAEPNGQALYTYNGDSSGVSNCTGTCLADWPIYQDKGATTGLPASVGTIKRKDSGQIQFTYNGLPLYTFTGDARGQVTGNGVEDFQIARPAASSGSSSSSSSNSSNSSNSPSSGNSGYNYNY